MAHVFDRPDDLVLEENFRLAKHLIQTLNNFCDHVFLAESLTVDILTALLEELTLRLLQTDESSITKVKDLSRFINMIILRLFATGRRMSIFRYTSRFIEVIFMHIDLFSLYFFRSLSLFRQTAHYRIHKNRKLPSWS
jgi:hypothetical protein